MTTTYDVSAFRKGPNGFGIQSLADPTNSGQLVTGGQKLLQRVICRLLLAKNSVPYKNIGTNFLNMLQVTGTSSEADIMSAFAGALLDLVPQLQGEESATDPLNERFKGLKLNTIVIAADSVSMNVTVLSLANLATNANIPLNFLLQ